MNVLIVGHACGPDLGSEPGNTWNWAQTMSRLHRVWVIAYPQHRAEVEAYLVKNPNPSLQFIWVTTNHPLDRWNPAKGDRGIQVHYVLWLSEAYKRAAETCRNDGIHLAHHVSLGTIAVPPQFWRLPVPSVWGPIGGGQTTPAQFLRFFGRQQWSERLRTARVKALIFSRGLSRAARDCNLILTTNKETLDVLKRVGATRVAMMLDCGLPAGYGPAALPAVQRPRSFTLLWAGRLEHRKGLQLGLEALAKVSDASVTLVVAGVGPEQRELETLASALGLKSRVTFLGRVPYQKMAEVFGNASAFLFTSLRDSFGSVVLEAMAHGLPVITLNHQGVGAVLPSDAAIKVEVFSPEQTVAALAAGIDRLAASTGLEEAMRLAAWQFAREQTWDRRALQMNRNYEVITGAPIAEIFSSKPE